jgi:hypothetical protein
MKYCTVTCIVYLLLRDLVVKLHLEKGLPVHDRHLHDVGDCTEHSGVGCQHMSIGAPQSPPILEPFIICFMSRTYGCLLTIAKFVAARRRLAVLVAIPISTVGQIILPRVQ